MLALSGHVLYVSGLSSSTNAGASFALITLTTSWSYLREGYHATSRDAVERRELRLVLVRRPRACQMCRHLRGLRAELPHLGHDQHVSVCLEIALLCKRKKR